VGAVGVVPTARPAASTLTAKLVASLCRCHEIKVSVVQTSISIHNDAFGSCQRALT